MYKRPITDPEPKKSSLKDPKNTFKRTQKKKEEIKAFKMPQEIIFLKYKTIKPKKKYLKNVYKMFCYITLDE